MSVRTRILVVFLIFVGITLAPSVLTPVPPRKYGLTRNGGGTPPSRFEWVLINLCHRLHIRTKFDEELDEAIQEADELLEQAEERLRQLGREQEEIGRLIEMQEKAWEEDGKKDSRKGSGN